MVRDWEKIGQPARMGVSRSLDTCRCFKFHQIRVYTKNFNYSNDSWPQLPERKKTNEYRAGSNNYYHLVPCQSINTNIFYKIIVSTYL